MQQPEYILQPLSDVLCEAVVLGTLLSSRLALDTVRGLLTEDCFTLPKHIAVFNAIHVLDNNGDTVDTITVWQEMQRHPPTFPFTVGELLEISNHSVPLIDNSAARLVDLAKRRHFELVAAKFRQAAHDETTDIDTLLTSARDDIDELLSKGTEQEITITESMKGVRQIMDRNKAGNKPSGTPTHFKLLDRYGGFHGGDFIVIAGETSMGKSSFALSMARNMVIDNSPIAYYSMEMQHTQLTARIMSMQSGVTSSAILYKPLSDTDLAKIDTATAELVGKNLYYDDNSVISIDAIIASIRTMKIKHDIQGAFIDYLQMLELDTPKNSDRGANKEQQTAKAARRLKNLAKSLDIWIVALSQMKRKSNDADPMPTMDRLRDSGQIAEAADVVMLAYRPEYYKPDLKFPKPFKDESTHNRAMIMVTKGRNIGVGKFICNFIPELTMFTEGSVNDIPITDNDTNDNGTETNELGEQLPF